MVRRVIYNVAIRTFSESYKGHLKLCSQSFKSRVTIESYYSCSPLHLDLSILIYFCSYKHAKIPLFSDFHIQFIVSY